MFTRFISLLVLVAPLASATLSINLANPTGLKSGGYFIVNWTSTSADDPPFSLELNNSAIFHNTLAIANNILPTSATGISVLIPSVPNDNDYFITAVEISNVNNIYAQTAIFSIGSDIAPSSGTPLALATTTGTSTNTGPLTTNTLVLPVTTPTSGSSSVGTVNSGTASGTAASTTASNAAVSSRLTLSNAYGYGVFLLSVIGGAVAVAV